MGFLDFLQAVANALNASTQPGAEPAITVVRHSYQVEPEHGGAVGLPAAVRPHDRLERIRREVEMIAPRFAQHAGVSYDEANCDWLMIPKYPLPEKWRARWCQLLIVFPEAYPATPPIGFYLNRRFSLKDGGKDHHLTGRAYNSAPSLEAQGWHWYCVNVLSGPGGWRPVADYRKPDNLWTFLALVREVLTSEG